MEGKQERGRAVSSNFASAQRDAISGQRITEDTKSCQFSSKRFR